MTPPSEGRIQDKLLEYANQLDDDGWALAPGVLRDAAAQLTEAGRAQQALRAQLHDQIMNLPCSRGVLECVEVAYANAYKAGHRDARHAAAELALTGSPSED